MHINDLEFKKFSGGELHLMPGWNNDNIDYTSCRIQSSDDLMKLCLLSNAFKDKKTLILPYIPYARQDRICNKGEALSIKVFANILNSLDWKEVVVLDPHSDVSVALIDNVTVVPQEHIWADTIHANYKYRKIDLIAPDAGAVKKIYNLKNEVPNVVNIRIGSKHRDTITRKVTETTVSGEKIGDVAIIVDDICDEGDTAIELAKVIKHEYEHVAFVVTHGIFSKGFFDLFNYFDKIYTTNSWNKDLESTDRLHVYDAEIIAESYLYWKEEVTV